MVILKKSQLQSGLDEGPGVVGVGGGGALLYLASVLNGYVPGACLCKDQCSGSGLTMTGHIPQVMITGHYFIDR